MLLLPFMALLLALVTVGALVVLLVLLRLAIPLVFLLAFLFGGLAILVLYPLSIIWAYQDAQSRGKPGWAVALLVAISPFLALVGWPMCLLAWIVFRPKKNTDFFGNVFSQAFGSTPAQP